MSVVFGAGVYLNIVRNTLITFLIANSCFITSDYNMIETCAKASAEFGFAQITKFTGPIWGPPGSWRPQMGPMLAPWTLLSGWFAASNRSLTRLMFIAVMHETFMLCGAYWTIVLYAQTKVERFCMLKSAFCMIILGYDRFLTCTPK